MNKIIDSNGKLFGKINLLDLIIFLLIAVALVGGIYKTFFVNNTVYLPDFKEGQITLKISNLNSMQCKAISKGDFVSVLGVQDLGTISDVSIENRMDNISSTDGKVYTVPNPLVFEVTIVIDATELYESKGFTYIGQSYKLNPGMALGISNGLLPCKSTLVSVSVNK